MSQENPVHDRIRGLIESSEVVLFMKGNRRAPECGFSATTVGILDSLLSDYGTFDVLRDPQIREGIKEFSSWPTIPQLYVKGEFIGGCDIIQELLATGEIFDVLGVPSVEVREPAVEIDADAAEALRQAAAQHAGPGQSLHLKIDACYQPNLGIAPDVPGEIQVEASGVTLSFDRLSAARADGIIIHLFESDRGPGFRIENPNAPQVRPMSPAELKAALDGGSGVELFDVRTPEEQEKARIPGAVLLTGEEAERIESLPRDTVLIFHCHHGMRSQQAAEHFASRGFENVFNLTGGIDAWSTEVDPSVPRYES